MSKKAKINLFLGLLVFGLIAVFLVIYLYLLPKAVESEVVQNFVKDEFFKITNSTLVIDNPKLKTSLSPTMEFSINNLAINKSQDNLLNLNDLDVKLSFVKLFEKRIELKHLKLSSLFIDVTKLIDIFPKSEKKEEKPTDWSFGFFNSDIDISKIQAHYKANDVLFDINLKNISLSKGEKRNYLHFDNTIFVKKGIHTITVSLSDENKVYIERNKLAVNKCNLRLNESIVNIDAMMDKKNRFKVNVFSKNFRVENVIDIIESNIIIPNGSQLLTNFSNIKGLFDLNFSIDNKGHKGNIDIKRISLGLVPINNIPLVIKKGNVKITGKDILLNDFVGFYEKHPNNDIKMHGVIKDYMKSFSTDIDIKAIVTNDFMKNYLSKMIGYSVELVGDADTTLHFAMKDNIMNMRWIFWINQDDDILIGGQPLSKYKLQRALVADMQIKDQILNIKKLDYYVTIPDPAKKIYKKILQLTGKIEFANGINFKEMGFDISEPLPSEFLNMVARADLFKGGTVVGKLKAVDGPKGVKLFGKINLAKIRVPSQRIYLEKAILETDFDKINIDAVGRYRRTKYKLDGEFVNNIAFPIIINNLNLVIDKINIGKMLESMNKQGQETTQVADLSNDDDETPTFDMSNLIIKNCTFKMTKGIYKELTITDLLATLTLDENSVLNLRSNRFGFANGISSCKVNCDLRNHQYKVKLGVKDVDSNLIASSLLGLKDEICGKAKGIIVLNSDKSLKLNGDMKFEINDGRIGTVGFLQYVLNVASIFRNPLAMVSPVTIWDLVNIPKGEFNRIRGSIAIKDNIIEQIKIKSTAPQLSSYIAGRFDLENRDASLRIYTKLSNKHKGVYGFLRQISLSSLASHLPLSSKTLYNLYNAEVKEIPEIDTNDKDCQIYFTKVEGDIEHNNFISSLKRIK